MSMTEPWPVDVVPVGPIAAGTTLWRRAGQLWVTVVAKATFAWGPGGVLTQAPPEEVRRAEKHPGENPVRSIRASTDLCPFLELADILFVGHACAPGGEPVPVVKVRLAIVRGSWFLLDKELLVYGDRAAPGADPKPFQRMPIVYERAFGGIGFGENPLGVETPNVVHADAERERIPAGLSPISWYWPSRKRALKAYTRALLDSAIADVPEDFDAECFQAAPEDQRIPFLRGEELIVLQGVHPAHPELMMRLPLLRGVARIYTQGGGGPPIALQADTLLIDGDAERCSITFRGCFSVPDEDAATRLSVAVGVEIGGNAIEWPDDNLRQSRASAKAAPEAAAKPAALAQEGWNERTVEIRSHHAAMKPATPFKQAGAAAASTSGRGPSLDGTVTLTGDEDDKVAYGAPFKITASGTSAVAPLPIPGAPWAGPAPASPVQPSPEAPLERTVSVGSGRLLSQTAEMQLPPIPAPPAMVKAPAPLPPQASPEPPKVAAEPPPAPPAVKPPPEPVKEPAPAEKPAWSWATPAPPPEAPPARPAGGAARPTPPPAVKNKLYGTFGPNRK